MGRGLRPLVTEMLAPTAKFAYRRTGCELRVWRACVTGLKGDDDA